MVGADVVALERIEFGTNNLVSTDQKSHMIIKKLTCAASSLRSPESCVSARALEPLFKAEQISVGWPLASLLTLRGAVRPCQNMEEGQMMKAF